jgi:hypothetical protein
MLGWLMLGLRNGVDMRKRRVLPKLDGLASSGGGFSTRTGFTQVHQLSTVETSLRTESIHLHVCRLL